MTTDGTSWRWLGTAYDGEPAAAVAVRESAHPGWGVDGDPDDWAMTLDGTSGSIEFAPDPAQGEGRLALWGGIGLMAASAILRRRW